MHQIVVTVSCRLCPPLPQGSGTGRRPVSMGSPTISTDFPVWIHCFPPPGNWGQKVTRNGGPQFGACLILSEKNSLNIKFLGGMFLGHPGPRRRDIPNKNFMQVAFFGWFRQGVAGMSRDLGRDVPDLEKLHARKLWGDFSYPTWGRRCPQQNRVP